MEKQETKLENQSIKLKDMFVLNAYTDKICALMGFVAFIMMISQLLNKPKISKL